MSKILLIADNHPNSSYRGAESSDRVLLEGLQCDFMTCEEYNSCLVTDYDKIIVSNFVSLSQEAKEVLMKHNFVTYNHDFLFVGSRIPSMFPDCIVPDEYKINVDFFNAAKSNYVQSIFQESIFKRNGILNVENLDGNLWTAKEINSMIKIGGSKNGRAAIISGEYKGEEQSVQFCKNLNIPFTVLPNMEREDFLQELSKFSMYVFIPYILESFCRVLYEAKLMRTISLTTNACGGVYSDLWNYNGEDLAEKLNEKREEILTKLKA
jgi:hypothetical protein